MLPRQTTNENSVTTSCEAGIVLRDVRMAYEQRGWLSDAKDCYDRTGNKERLEALKALAIDRDLFLLGRLALLIEVTSEDWRQAGEAAFKSGRFRYAAAAFERAGDDARAASAREKVAAHAAEVRRPEVGRWTSPAAEREAGGEAETG